MTEPGVELGTAWASHAKDPTPVSLPRFPKARTPADSTLQDETMMTIHFNANLRPLLGKHVGMLHWVMDPEVSGFIIGYDLGDNQVLICNFDVCSFIPSIPANFANKSFFSPKGTQLTPGTSLSAARQ